MTSTAGDVSAHQRDRSVEAVILRKPQHLRIQRGHGRRRQGNHHVHSRRLRVGPADEARAQPVHPRRRTSAKEQDCTSPQPPADISATSGPYTVVGDDLIAHHVLVSLLPNWYWRHTVPRSARIDTAPFCRSVVPPEPILTHGERRTRDCSCNARSTGQEEAQPRKTTMSILIVGAGAVGGYLVACCSPRAINVPGSPGQAGAASGRRRSAYAPHSNGIDVIPVHAVTASGMRGSCTTAELYLPFARTWSHQRSTTSPAPLHRTRESSQS